MRALHEAAHAVVALLIGVDFQEVVLPGPDDDAIGLRFQEVKPDGEPNLVVSLQVQRQLAMRYAGEAIEEHRCGVVRYASADAVDSQAEAASITPNEKEAYNVRRLAKARARVLVDLGLPLIEGVAEALLRSGRLSWGEVAELVLPADDRS